jgi:hypothetical protein
MSFQQLTFCGLKRWFVVHPMKFLGQFATIRRNSSRDTISLARS